MVSRLQTRPKCLTMTSTNNSLLRMIRKQEKLQCNCQDNRSGNNSTLFNWKTWINDAIKTSLPMPYLIKRLKMTSVRDSCHGDDSALLPPSRVVTSPSFSRCRPARPRDCVSIRVAVAKQRSCRRVDSLLMQDSLCTTPHKHYLRVLIRINKAAICCKLKMLGSITQKINTKFK